MKRLTLILLTALGLLTSCSRQAADGEDASVFIFARGSDAQKLDPADVDDGESVNVLAQICEGLVRFVSGSLEIEPCLAESYTVSEDGLRYRFRLREGVRFHDGVALDAAAAVFSFRRQMDSEHPGWLPEAAFSYWNYLYQDVEAVEAVGPMELEIRLARPNASMLRSLAIFPAWLVSPLSFESEGAAGQRRPIGTGPYRFVEWRPNEAIVLERNAGYWGELAGFERLIFKVVPDNTARLMQLRSGDVHAMDGLQPLEAAALERDERFELHKAAGLNVAYLAFNLEDERMARPEVRQALAMAIDRERFAAVALEGAGQAADYPIPPGFLGYPEELEPVPYDLERARALIEPHLGLFADRPLIIRAMNAPRPYTPDPMTAATFLQGQLQALGLETRVATSDFKSHLDALRNGDFEIGLIGWVGDNGDTDNFLSVFFGSWAAERGSATNYSFYRNEEMDTLLLAARAETNEDRRAELYRSALALWRRDLPLLPLCHGDSLVALAAGFEGFEMQKTGDLRLGGLRPKGR